MEARPKLKPGQTGTKKLVELSGFRLVCLCYLRGGISDVAVQRQIKQAGEKMESPTANVGNLG